MEYRHLSDYFGRGSRIGRDQWNGRHRVLVDSPTLDRIPEGTSKDIKDSVN